MERAKKECILEAAARAFTRFGFKKASIDEIARQAGVAKGTVYLACESKEDLFYQSLHRELRAWIADCSRLIDPRVPADELFELVLRSSLAFLLSRPLLLDLFMGRYHPLLPEWSERLDELRTLGRASTIEILRLGIRQGRFRPDLDVEIVASLLQDLHLASHLFHAGEQTDLPRLERRLKAGLDLILNGLRAPRAATARG
jgi:AcrR family transcriptional regulator